MSTHAALHAIVLAAGASRRFGSPKQLARVDGGTMIQQAAARAAEVAGAAVSVILGAHAAEIAPALGLSSATIHLNYDWSEGMASSIRLGVRRLPGSCAGVLLMPCDQPLVGAEPLSRLAAAWMPRPRSLVAAQYAGITGVPAIFPRWCFNDLIALRGDQGARALLHRYADHVIRLEIPEAAIDIDRPEDLLLSGAHLSQE
jgi:molybdenum cofactor cytidylyltransferase